MAVHQPPRTASVAECFWHNSSREVSSSSLADRSSWYSSFEDFSSSFVLSSSSIVAWSRSRVARNSLSAIGLRSTLENFVPTIHRLGAHDEGQGDGDVISIISAKKVRSTYRSRPMMIPMRIKPTGSGRSSSKASSTSLPSHGSCLCRGAPYEG